MSEIKTYIYRNINQDDFSSESHFTFEIFNEELATYIQEGNWKSLFIFINQTKSIDILIEFPYEVLCTIITFLFEKSNMHTPRNYCSIKVLQYLSIYCEPSELFLYVIEQMELLGWEYCFYFLLDPLKVCLFRTNKFLKVIDMCIESIKNTISHLALSSDEDCKKYDNNIEQFTLAYINISNFIDSLLNHLRFSEINYKLYNKTKYLILNFLISMFGKPVCFINLNWEIQEIIFIKILRNVMLIEADVFFFFRFINHGNLDDYLIYVRNVHTDHFQFDQMLPFSNDNDLSLCNFFWVVFQNTVNIKFPKVYNPHYIAQNCINISNCLMIYKRKETIAVIKALDIMFYFLKIVNTFLIPFDSLDLEIHRDFIQNITEVISINESTVIQKYATKIFIKYIYQFNDKAKYFIIIKILDLNCHSVIKTTAISIVKNIVTNLLINIQNEDINLVNEMFLGNTLELIISRMCILKHGLNTDLIEISDQLITTLNLILFLVIKNSKNCNILNFFKKTQYYFLKTVKTAVDIQKSEWLKYNPVDHNTEIVEHSFISPMQNIQLWNQSMNRLFMIENIVHRIFEIINIKFLNDDLV